MELTVTAHDRSHRMHRKTTTRTFRQMTVTDIARKMAGEHGVKVGTLANLPGGAAEERHQVGETDWEYLSRLVHNHGGELDVAAGAMHIIDPTKTKAAAAELVYGETLQRFRPRVSALGQAAKVNVRGWDVKKKAAIAKKRRAEGVDDDAGLERQRRRLRQRGAPGHDARVDGCRGRRAREGGRAAPRPRARPGRAPSPRATRCCSPAST